jgi:hypothetical protein
LVRLYDIKINCYYLFRVFEKKIFYWWFDGDKKDIFWDGLICLFEYCFDMRWYYKIYLIYILFINNYNNIKCW